VPWLDVYRRRGGAARHGDELFVLESGRPNQIVSSNNLALAALVRSCGGEAIDSALPATIRRRSRRWLPARGAPTPGHGRRRLGRRS